MNHRHLRIAFPRAILGGVVALTLLAAQPAVAQSFFSYPPAPPVASPSSDVVVQTSIVRVNTPFMYLDGGGNPRQHSWFMRADGSSLTITLQAGLDSGLPINFGSPTTFTVTVVEASIPSPPVLATFTVTQPASTPPAATNSATIVTTPGTTYRVNITSPGQVPGPFVPFGIYRLKVDGAQELEPLGAPASVGPFSSAEAGTRWVMNVAPGEALNFAVLGGQPCAPQLPGAACPVTNTEVSVFDPNHQLQSIFMSPVVTSGSNFSIPTAGNTPGAWMIVVDQQPGNPPPSAYRLQKGIFVDTSLASASPTPGTSGADPAVYSAWFTDGKGLAQFYVYAPAAVTSVGATLTRDLFTGHGDFGLTGSQAITIATNQTVNLGDSGGGADVGQYHATFTPPAGYTAFPDHIDVPITVDALTTVVVHVKDATPPVLTLPSNFFVEATSSSGASVSYAASASDFIEGPVSVNCLPASGTTFVLGPTTVNCSASDSVGNVAMGHFTVTVRDTTPPVIASVTPSEGSLWPPNHKMVNITIAVSDSDNVDPAPACSITGVTSNEPVDADGDWIITPNSLSLKLRSERLGTGNGRIYTMTVACTDSTGHVSTKSTTAVVPHDQGH